MRVFDYNGRQVKSNLTPDSRAKVHVAPVRDLTPGEIRVLQTVFGSALDYSKVKIHNETYLPFQDVPVTPNGEIFYTPEEYQPDFSASPLHLSVGKSEIRKKNTFVHEVAHAWQHQHGRPVRLAAVAERAGCFLIKACGDPYQYILDPKIHFSDYGVEQQAQILADYYCLKYLSHMKSISNVMTRDNLSIQKIFGAYIDYPVADEKIREKSFRDYWLGLYEKTVEGVMK